MRGWHDCSVVSTVTSQQKKFCDSVLPAMQGDLVTIRLSVGVNVCMFLHMYQLTD